MLDRRLQTDAQSQQVADLRPRPAPLFPVTHGHAAAQPLIQRRDRPVILADANVPEPSPQEVPQFVQSNGHGNPPTSPRQFPDPVLEVCQRLVAPAYLRAAQGESEETAVTHRRHLAPGRIDLEFEAGLQVTREILHHALPGPLAFDQNDPIVRIAGKAMAPPFEFLVELVQQNVCLPKVAKADRPGACRSR